MHTLEPRENLFDSSTFTLMGNTGIRYANITFSEVCS
jgi:hypothetical protein